MWLVTTQGFYGVFQHRRDHGKARAQWITALAQLVSESDFGNFKSAVASKQGGERAHLYGEIWRILSSLQRQVP